MTLEPLQPLAILEKMQTTAEVLVKEIQMGLGAATDHLQTHRQVEATKTVPHKRSISLEILHFLRSMNIC